MTAACVYITYTHTATSYRYSSRWRINICSRRVAEDIVVSPSNENVAVIEEAVKIMVAARGTQLSEILLIDLMTSKKIASPRSSALGKAAAQIIFLFPIAAITSPRRNESWLWKSRGK